MMRVLIDGDIYARSRFGGTIRYYDNIIQGLADKSIHIDVLLTAPPKKALAWESSRVRVIERVGNDSYDLHFTVDYSSLLIDDVRTVLPVHDLIDVLFPQLVPPGGSVSYSDEMRELVLRRADHIIAVSDTTKNDLIRCYGLSADKITRVYHGINRIFLEAPHRLSQAQVAQTLGQYKLSRPFILCVGERQGYKNFLSLLRAFQLAQLYRDFDLVNVGGRMSFCDEEMEYIRQFALENMVRLLGYVPDPALAALYKSSALFVAPSLYEGFGFPLVEAMACGAVTASSRAPALVEIGGGVPIIFDGLDVQSIASAMLSGLLLDQTERVTEGVVHAATFSWEAAIQHTLDILINLVQPQRLVAAVV